MNAAAWPRLIGSVALASLTIAGIWLLHRYDPNVAGSPFPPCLFHLLTDYYCIGCGLTRALHALLHGDPVRAFGLNPLAMTLLLLLPVMVAWGHGWQPRPLRPLMQTVLQPRLWLWLLPGYFIARNLPWPPFSWLAPL